MKLVIKFFLLCCIVFSGLCYSAELSKIYSNERSALVLAPDAGGYRLVAVGGSVGNDQGASADCQVIAELKSDGQSYVGNLRGVHSEILSYDDMVAQNKAVSLMLSKKSVFIRKLDVTDLCGVQVSFEGVYENNEYNSKDFLRNYAEAISVVNEGSLYFYKKGDYVRAADELRPFVKSIDWIFIGNTKGAGDLVAAANNYAFYLQKSGNNVEAIEVFKKIVSVGGDRVVVYLNMADSFWELKDVESAKKYYSIYVREMKKAGKSNKIPARVLRRQAAG